MTPTAPMSRQHPPRRGMSGDASPARSRAPRLVGPPFLADCRPQRRKELHRPPLPPYNRPTAGAPGLDPPQHVTSGDGSRGPMLLNTPGPILLKTDSGKGPPRRAPYRGAWLPTNDQLRNRRSRSPESVITIVGTRDHDPAEPVITMRRNGRSACVGIRNERAPRRSKCESVEPQGFSGDGPRWCNCHHPRCGQQEGSQGKAS